MLLPLPPPPTVATTAATSPQLFSRPPPPPSRPSLRVFRPLTAFPCRKYGCRHRDPITTSFSDDDEYFEDEEEDETEDEEEEEEGPVEKRKPRGFGVGKNYDTAIEEQLLREMGLCEEEQSQSSVSHERQDAPAKQRAASIAADVSTSGVCVRVWNLPRKKNIDRDLKLAFKGFPGLITISPAVSANKKTRDPICKGFAFIGMESVEAATRFVELYSRKTLAFGKVEKQISCCVVDRPSSINALNQASATPVLFQPKMKQQNVAAASSSNNRLTHTSETFGNESEKTLVACGRTNGSSQKEKQVTSKKR